MHERLVSLHKLGVKNLPTTRLVAWSLFGFAVGCVVAVALLGAGLTVFAAILFALLAFDALHIFERVRAIRTGRLGTGVTERILDHWITGGAETSWNVIEAALRPGAEAVETAAELGVKAAARVLGPRKQKWADDIVAATEDALEPGEKRLVSLRATIHPHGINRLFLYLSFGVAAAKYVRGGVLTVTDRRLIFHRIRGMRGRQRYELYLTEPLESLVVLEWFKGLGASERWQQVLILRRPDGSVLRMMLPRLYWRDEARAAFELVASAAADVPPALRRFWGLPESERPQPKPGPTPAATTSPPAAAAAPKPVADEPTTPSGSRRRWRPAAIAGAALVGLVVVAVVVATGQGGDDGSEDTEATTPVEEPEPPVSPAVLRMREERERLRAWVADDVRDSCTNRARLVLTKPRRPIASIHCDLRGTAGMDVWGYENAGGAIAEWRTQTKGLDRGFCSRSVWNVQGRWHYEGERKPSGRLSCYDDDDGTAWIEWTHNGERIFALASRTDGNRGALYGAWLRAY